MAIDIKNMTALKLDSIKIDMAMCLLHCDTEYKFIFFKSGSGWGLLKLHLSISV